MLEENGVENDVQAERAYVLLVQVLSRHSPVRCTGGCSARDSERFDALLFLVEHDSLRAGVVRRVDE